MAKLTQWLMLLALASLAAASNLTLSNDYYRISFGHPISQLERAEVESSGLQIVGYGGNFTYIARAAHNTTLSWRDLLHSYISMPPAPQAVGAEENITVLIYPGEDDSAMLSAIRAIAPASSYDGQTIVVQGTDAQLQAIRAMPGVMMASVRSPNQVLNDYAAPILGASDVWSRLNLTGNNTIVGVGDTGLDTGNLTTMHADIRGRVVGISAWCDHSILHLNEGVFCSGLNSNGMDKMGHGTHVTGSIMGNGTNSNGAIKGMAYNARVFFQSLNGDGQNNINVPANLENLFDESYNNGARLHSNSWGGGADSYGSDSFAIDDFSYNNPDFLILFAAGNAGPSASTLGSQAVSKNAITVGSVGTTRPSVGSAGPTVVSGFSSRGPASDGRFKPDLMAPGEMILSTLASTVNANWCGRGNLNAFYSYCSGTSMATPLTTGSATLVRDYLITNRSMPSPPSSMIKAILIAGADDLPGYGATPNSNEGFGRVNLTKSLPQGNYSLNISYSNMTTGGAVSQVYRIKAGGWAKFALVWTDPACTGNGCDSQALVNDLDLSVTLPNGTVYYGNSRGDASAGPDRKNNAEMVELNTSGGDYVVNVTGFNVPLGPQPFSLAVVAPLENGTISIQSPSGNYQSGSVPLAFTAQIANLDSCWYSLDGAGPVALPSCQNTTLGPLTEGAHNLTVFANNTSGAIANSSTVFTIDLTPPIVVGNSPQDGTVLPFAAVPFNFTASDNLAHSLSCGIVVDGSPASAAQAVPNGTSAVITVPGLSVGQHIWAAVCNDSAMNSANSTPSSFYLTQVSAALSAPPPGFYSGSSSLNLGWTCYGNVSAFLANLTIDGLPAATSLASPNGTLTSFAASGLADGLHHWGVACYNQSAQGSSGARAFTVDTAPPSVTLLSPADGSSTTSPKLSFSVSDSISPSDNCTLLLDGSPNINITASNGTAQNITVSGLPDGPHSWSVSCSDLAGNQNSSPIRSFTSDTSPPSVALLAPADGTRSNVLQQSLNFSASDGNDASLACSLVVDGSVRSTNASVMNGSATSFQVTLSPSSHTWDVNCTDGAGNAGNGTQRAIVVDTTAPTVVLSAPANNSFMKSSSINLTYTPADADDSSLSCTLILDGAQNMTNPSAPNNTASKWQATGLPDGLHNWATACTDAAGNTNVSVLRAFTVDANPPSITALAPLNNSVTGSTSVNITFRASDAVFPVFNCSLALDGSTIKTNSSTANNTVSAFSAMFLAAKTHNWSIRCWDRMNNSGATPLQLFTVDTMPPMISFAQPTPAAGSVRHLGYVAVNVSASDATLANVTIRIYDSNRTMVNSSSSPSSFLANFTNLPDGLYYFNATASDAAGHISRTPTWNVSLDNAPPAIAVNSPMNNSIYNISSVRVNLTITEAHPLRTWYFNGYNTTYLTPATVYFTQGPHNLTIWSSDASGLISSTYVNFTIDTMPPAIGFLRPTPASSSSWHLGYIQLNVSANDSTLANITVNLYDSSRALVNSTSSEASPFFVNFTGLPDGVYYFNATAYDRAGHQKSTLTYNATLDNVPPAITILSPLNGTYSSPVRINISVSEAHPYRTWYSTGSYNTTYTMPALAYFTKGPHNLTVWSNDSSGLLSAANVSFSVN